MSSDPLGKRHHLEKLPPEYYRGGAWVHWNMTIKKRARGWLDELHHSRLREALLHTCGRYGLVCPVYCLMPDHGHFLWCGYRSDSDQRVAVSFFRKLRNGLLREGGHELQKQPFDRVLRKDERDPFAFEDTCDYIMNNPARARLVEDWREWKFVGSMVPGYPVLHPSDHGFWARFWSFHADLQEEGLDVRFLP